MPGKLDRYNSKRDFARTLEPRGQHKPGRATGHRYVIQKHAARRLHYDLRLELDGVFKSWAVTRGPSLNPNDKRLAVEVEDHPLPYGDFEGTIPKGQYGGGTVQLWDRGFWRPESSQAPAQSLKAGELKFSLDGERLHGEWVLVRMRRDRSSDKRNNWLLIKHRGGAAGAERDTAQLMALDESVASGRTMAEIAADKGPKPKPFIAKGKRPRAAPKAPAGGARMPTFIEPELCKLQKTPPAGAGWIHEAKLDGYRIQLRVSKGRVTLKTRKGLDWTRKFPGVATAAAGLPDCILDGELVALDEKLTPSFSALQAALSQGKTGKLIYYGFDLLNISGNDLRPRPLLERKEQLRRLLDAQSGESPLRFVDQLTGDSAQILASACKMGLEGIISKRADAPYESTRSGSWVKTKCRAGQEIILGGWTRDGRQVRSLLGGVMRQGKLAYVGRIGTGFGARTNAQLLPRLTKLTRAQDPFSGTHAPRADPDVLWLKPELVAEVEFAGWTGDRLLRQAAFKGLRGDKPAREVEIEKPAADSKRIRRPSGEVQLSHPTKVLWPATAGYGAITKQELADYYAQMSGALLEHIQGRPCSLLRAPDGIGSSRFFQRHAMPGQSPLLTLTKVSGDKRAYLEVNSPGALLAVAQLAGLELHPWNCAVGDPARPGRLVFDLDPAPEVSFTAVVTAALELRERLLKVGLESLCKTTGGKGLHVVVPLRVDGRKADIVSWASAKLFAQTLCAQMQADTPRNYLINASKAARKGRIFLDYLRNDKTATAVAPLSPRARPGAPVSMPLKWSQVRASLDPSDYTVTSAGALLKKSNAWSDYRDLAGSLAAAARKLVA